MKLSRLALIVLGVLAVTQVAAAHKLPKAPRVWERHKHAAAGEGNVKHRKTPKARARVPKDRPIPIQHVVAGR